MSPPKHEQPVIPKHMPRCQKKVVGMSSACFAWWTMWTSIYCLICPRLLILRAGISTDRPRDPASQFLAIYHEPWIQLNLFEVNHDLQSSTMLWNVTIDSSTESETFVRAKPQTRLLSLSLESTSDRKSQLHSSHDATVHVIAHVRRLDNNSTAFHSHHTGALIPQRGNQVDIPTGLEVVWLWP